MSIAIIAEVWKSPCNDASTLLLLLALADWSNDQAESWPAIPALAAKSRLSERSCRYLLRRLERVGVLEVLIGGGRKRPNTYHINLQTLQTMQPLPPLQGFTKKTLQTTTYGNPANPAIPASRAYRGRSDPEFHEPSEERSPSPPLSPQGEVHEEKRKKSATPRRQKTPFPTTPDQQAALKASLLDAAFETWYAGTGLRHVLARADLDWQWEQFALDADANNRAYTSWRAAFMKWLGSKYQERNKTPGTPAVDLMAWAKEQDRLDQERTIP